MVTEQIKLHMNTHSWRDCYTNVVTRV